MTIRDEGPLASGGGRHLDFRPGMAMWWEITRSTEDSAGELFEATNWIEPGMAAPPVHVHPSAEESDQVVEGAIEVFMDGSWSRVGPGEGDRARGKAAFGTPGRRRDHADREHPPAGPEPRGVLSRHASPDRAGQDKAPAARRPAVGDLCRHAVRPLPGRDPLDQAAAGGLQGARLVGRALRFAPKASWVLAAGRAPCICARRDCSSDEAVMTSRPRPAIAAEHQRWAWTLMPALSQLSWLRSSSLTPGARVGRPPGAWTTRADARFARAKQASPRDRRRLSAVVHSGRPMFSACETLATGEKQKPRRGQHGA